MLDIPFDVTMLLEFQESSSSGSPPSIFFIGLHSGHCFLHNDSFIKQHHTSGKEHRKEIPDAEKMSTQGEFLLQHKFMSGIKLCTVTVKHKKTPNLILSKIYKKYLLGVIILQTNPTFILDNNILHFCHNF